MGFDSFESSFGHFLMGIKLLVTDVIPLLVFFFCRKNNDSNDGQYVRNSSVWFQVHGINAIVMQIKEIDMNFRFDAVF